MQFNKCILVLVASFLVIYGQVEDPTIINNGFPISELSEMAPEAEIQCPYDTMSNTVCPEVWKPVCGAENVTYWNCCFHAVYANSTTYTEGKCGDDAPIFLTDDEFVPSDIPVELMPVRDGTYSMLGSRKLQTFQDDA